MRSSFPAGVSGMRDFRSGRFLPTTPRPSTFASGLELKDRLGRTSHAHIGPGHAHISPRANCLRGRSLPRPIPELLTKTMNTRVRRPIVFDLGPAPTLGLASSGYPGGAGSPRGAAEGRPTKVGGGAGCESTLWTSSGFGPGRGTSASMTSHQGWRTPAPADVGSKVERSQAAGTQPATNARSLGPTGGLCQVGLQKQGT